MSGTGILLLGLFGVIICGLIYFLPTIIAKKRKNQNQNTVFIINLFLGWTLVGWLIALMRALSDTQAVILYTTPQKTTASSELMELKTLMDSGAITQEEFNTQKKRLLK